MKYDFNNGVSYASGNDMSEEQRYHWYQNSQNTFWKSPYWIVDTKFDHKFNEELLDEVYNIGRDIVNGTDSRPHGSIWDYDRPCLNALSKEILSTVMDTITREISQIRMLNITSCEHIFGWVNVHEPGVKLEVHGHTESAIAATYYLRTKPDCGDIVLYDTSKSIDFDGISLTNTPGVVEHRITPKEGQLIFFPSYVLHGVEENKSDDLRISLTTDIRKVIDRDASATVILKSWGNRMRQIREWSK